MQRITARWLALLAITLIALYLCWLVVSPFVQIILWAVVLAIIAFPYHTKLLRRGVHPTLAAMISTVGVVLVVLLPVLIIVVSVATQIPTYDQIHTGVEKLRALIAEDSALYQKVDGYFDLDWLKDKQLIQEKLNIIATPVLSKSIAIAGSLVGTVVDIFFALFTLFYFLKDSREIGNSVSGMLPLEVSQSQAVFDRCKSIIQASVQGVILIAAIQGVLGGIAFWILGVPSAILLAVLLFILSMVPAIGSVLVWLPAALYLGATGHWIKAAILIAWCGGVVGMVDNLLRPKLVGKKTGMHDLVIFFSVLGGLQVFGILGLFVGPVVVAITRSIIEICRTANLYSRDLPVQTNIDGKEIVVPVVATTLQHPMEIDPPGRQ